MGLFDFFRSKPGKEHYAKQVIKAAADAGHPAALRYEAEEFRLVSSGERTLVINLENGYRAYCKAPRTQRARVVTAFIQSMTAPELPASFAAARASLRPLIRSRATLEYLRLMPGTLPGPNTKPYIDASAPFSADAVMMLACDSERSIQTLSGATLEEWGVSFEQAWTVAVDNLRDMTVSSFEQVQPGIYLGGWNDSYETSRLLFSDLFYRLPLGGEPVVMAPSRNKLLAASANNRDALIGMLALARTLAEQEGRQVSALMYCFKEGKPVEYLPDDANVADLADGLKKLFLADDYQSQKDQLDKANEASRQDVFVATYILTQSKETGRLRSYGVWSDQVDTLLPEVDLVALRSVHEESGEPEVRVVEWSELRQHVKELQHSEQGYPARYRLQHFPSRELLERLTCVDMQS